MNKKQAASAVIFAGTMAGKKMTSFAKNELSGPELYGWEFCPGWRASSDTLAVSFEVKCPAFFLLLDHGENMAIYDFVLASF